VILHGPEALEALLRQQLGPAIRRERWLRLWRGFAACAAAGALLALALLLFQERTGSDAHGPWVVLLAGTAAAIGLHAFRVRRRAPDHRAIARRIEAGHPDLRALLLTAVGQAPARPGERLGFLQEQVVREALRLATPDLVVRAVRPRQLWLSGAAAALATLVLLVVTAGALTPGLPALLPDQHGLIIHPGDTEAERGTSVLVLARFTKKVPSGATLLVRMRGRPAQRIEMTKNLDDPVFGGLTPPLAAEEARYQVEYAGRRSGRFRIRSFEHPDLERIDARVEYPRHPGLAAREIKDARYLAVVAGARLTLTVHLNKPVREARLAGEGGPELRLQAAAGRRLQTITFEPDRSRRLELRLEDDRGRTNRLPPRITIDVHANLPPQITSAFPGRDVRASPLEELTVEARVQDDLGLLAFGVSYALVGQESREVRLGGPASAGKEHLARAVIDLEALGAEPDQLLSYYFWADDRDRTGKARRVSGDMYFVEVRPFEEHFREAAGQGARDGQGRDSPAEELARRQKEIVNAIWRLAREAREGTPAGRIRSDAAVVAKAQAEHRDAAQAARQEARGAGVRALAEAMLAMSRTEAALDEAARQADLLIVLPDALAAAQTAYAALLRLQDRERQVARGQGRGGGGGTGREQRELSGLELKSKESRYETRREATGAAGSKEREDRALVGRLQDLAQRQKALSDRLKELQAALQAQKDEEQEERRSRLKRLREEQQELLSDLDRLVERMQAPENRGRMAQARAELEQTRAEAQAAAEALARGEESRALGASTRAERGLDRARDQLKRQVAQAFGEEVRGLREEARRLDETQQGLGQRLGRAAGLRGGPAPSPTENRLLAEARARQKKDVSGLLERVQRLTEKSEGPAPLLARKLYDSYRRAMTEDLEQALGRAGEMVLRNMPAEAAPAETRAGRLLGQLRRDLDEAAKGVLGDEAEALRLARSELDALLAEGRRERSGAGSGPGGEEGPITGDNFQGFDERLRDLQDLLGEPRLRNQAARVRDRARSLRGEFKRHSRKPEWSLFEAQVLTPLSELRDHVVEELRRLQPDDKPTPVDRDPVPGRFSDLVRRYYESLGKGK
jgi:hypothetical protein